MKSNKNITTTTKIDATDDIRAQLAELSQGQSTIERDLAEVAELLRGHQLSARGTIDPAALDLRNQVRAIVEEYLRTPDAPTDTAKIGDAPTPELAREIRRLLAGRPMTVKELVDATGAKPHRVNWCVIAMRRDKKSGIRNVGSAARAVYTIPNRRAPRAS